MNISKLIRPIRSPGLISCFLVICFACAADLLIIFFILANEGEARGRPIHKPPIYRPSLPPRPPSVPRPPREPIFGGKSPNLILESSKSSENSLNRKSLDRMLGSIKSKSVENALKGSILYRELGMKSNKKYNEMLPKSVQETLASS